MTAALVVYSATFARYALAVTPKNYLLFACHTVNFSAQVTQGYRYLNYWKYVITTTFLLLFYFLMCNPGISRWDSRDVIKT